MRAHSVIVAAIHAGISGLSLGAPPSAAPHGYVLSDHYSTILDEVNSVKWFCVDYEYIALDAHFFFGDLPHPVYAPIAKPFAVEQKEHLFSAPRLALRDPIGLADPIVLPDFIGSSNQSLELTATRRAFKFSDD